MQSTKLIRNTLGCPYKNATNDLKEISAQTYSSDDERLAKYNEELEAYYKACEEWTAQGGTPLFEHELLFTNESGRLRPSMVTRVLQEDHASGALIKGPIIFGFNFGHSGTTGPIVPGMDFSEHVHHGTTRILNPDGTFNENNWKALVEFVKEKQGENDTDIIRQSTLENFVKFINERDGYEPENGRRKVLTTFIQDEAGKAARQQMFDLLHCGYKHKLDSWFGKEPCMKMSDLELFFRHMPAALLKAKYKVLPIDNIIPEREVTATASHEAIVVTPEIQPERSRFTM